MKILIFGGAGFIGTNLCELLLANPENKIHVFDNLSMGNMLAKASLSGVNLIQGDMTDYLAVKKVILEVQPERIFHLAANSDIAASATNNQVDLDNTLQTTVVLTAALRGSSVKDLVFASSSAVYGEVAGEITESTRKSPASPYGWMKLASENVLAHFARENPHLRYLCVRFPNVTGRWQTHGVVHDLVNKLKSNSSALQVLGDGTQTKPYTLASELCEAILEAIDSPWQGCMDLNISPNSRSSVKYIAETIVQVSGLSPVLTYGKNRSGWLGDVPEYRYDTTKFETLTACKLRSSDQAILESAKWQWAFISGS